MKYDVIKSTDQLMGIWGLGKVEKKDSDTKMIPHTKHSTPPAPVATAVLVFRPYQYRLVSMPEVAEMGYLPNAPHELPPTQTP